MLAGLYNAIFSEEFLKLASEAVASTSISDVFFSLLLCFLMAVFALQISHEVSKIYLVMEYEGLKYFKNAFFFYGLANFLLSILSLIFLLAKSSASSALYLLGLSIVPIFLLTGICFWFAKANLLSSITWKLVEGFVRKRVYRSIYFIFVMLLILIDGLIYSLVLMFAGPSFTIIYKAFVFALILYFIRSNMRSGSEKKPITSPYYLGLILIFTLNFMANFSLLFEGNSAELIGSAFDILTLLSYVIILKGIKKWSRVLI